MYLEDVLKEFLFDCKLRRLSERTLKGYNNNRILYLDAVAQKNLFTVSE